MCSDWPFDLNIHHGEYQRVRLAKLSIILDGKNVLRAKNWRENSKIMSWWTFNCEGKSVGYFHHKTFYAHFPIFYVGTKSGIWKGFTERAEWNLLSVLLWSTNSQILLAYTTFHKIIKIYETTIVLLFTSPRCSDL